MKLSERDFCTPMFIAALFTVSEVKTTSDGWIKCDTCVHSRILFNHKKEGSPTVCLNMDETGGNYAKTNKPDRERQIVCGLTFIGNLRNKKMELIGTESWKMMVARD